MRPRLKSTIVCLGIALAAAPAHAAVVASWSFSEGMGSTTADGVGSVTGNLAGSAALVGGGISGGAVSLSRTGNGLVSMGDNFNFTGTQTFTIQAWVKTSDTVGDIVVGRHVSGFQNGYFLALNDVNDGGVIEPNGSFKFYQSDANALNSGAAGVNNNEWHQVVGVHDGVNNQIRIYLDGSRTPMSMSTDPLNPITGSAAPFGIGMVILAGMPTSAYTGLVDEVRIWDHALSDEEVGFFFRNSGAIPEPMTGMLLLGSLAMAIRRRRA